MTVQSVLQVLCHLSLRYPEAGYSPEQLLVLAEGFFEDLTDENISQEDFELFVRTTRKVCKFFPKMSDILDVRKKERERGETGKGRKKVSGQLEERTADLTPEEVARNLRHIEIIKKMLAGDLSMDDAVNEQDRIKFYAQGDSNVIPLCQNTGKAA